MSFDPEKVEKFDCELDHPFYGEPFAKMVSGSEYVRWCDYDHLLALYRKLKKQLPKNK